MASKSKYGSIFASSREEGLEAYRLWKQSHGNPNLDDLRVSSDVLLVPWQVSQLTISEGQKCFKKRRDDIVIMRESRLRDNSYPVLDRFYPPKKKNSIPNGQNVRIK
ncbi:hypothetical protein PoB_005800400 [Plakobranchus ocellatus]|uniref:Uncharacterized protein n=1 Tax=Plakobranchus ocellatus TaxID=259542 RepID=A0AAV4CKN8_9GAST|nr:hypothetical protein PoB_005800400 [Plakobranchus ocellatus]